MKMNAEVLDLLEEGDLLQWNEFFSVRVFEFRLFKLLTLNNKENNIRNS